MSLKEVTRKTVPRTFAERIAKLKEIYRGWLNYFRMGSIQAKLKEIDSWVRNRLRYCIWHNWKKVERKRKNLIRLGIPKGQAYAWSRTRMGGWAVAQSPILITTITLSRLVQRGYESMLSYYEKVSPQLNPDSDRDCIRDPYSLSRTLSGYSGVRGAPHQLKLVGPSTRLWLRARHTSFNLKRS